MRSPLRPLGLGLCIVFALLLVGCAETVEGEDECAPACEARECGDDGCGGSCGACEAGAVCTEAGTCVADDGCEATCEDLGLECGEHCGASCGTCGDAEVCADGLCECAPDCLGKACGDDDGCGGTCGPCPRDASCEDCPLRVLVVDREVEDGRLVGVTIAVDFQPEDGVARPGIADVRLRVGGPAHLERVGMGAALVDAGKELHVDAATGRAWRTLPDGVVQTMVLGTKSAKRIEGGRWLLHRFRVGTEERPARVPVTFSLVEREAIFAPTDADQALWGEPLGEPVSVWPEVSGAQ
ncbi:MAG: hypothetical protein ACQEXJ_15795 [Myxococcota bacterium]